MAEYSEGMHGESMAQKTDAQSWKSILLVIQITEDADRQSLKDQVSVSLSEMLLDVMKGHIGVALNKMVTNFHGF